jgi:hypothetical protein
MAMLAAVVLRGLGGWLKKLLKKIKFLFDPEFRKKLA